MKYSDPYVGCRSESGRLRWLLATVVVVNLLWAVCFLRGGAVDEEEIDNEYVAVVDFEGGRNKRSDYFDKEARGIKLIQFVRCANIAIVNSTFSN